MGEKENITQTDPDRRRVFVKHLLQDLQALEQMLAAGTIESGVTRIGAEQELVLIDASWQPAPVALAILDDLDDERFTTELASFNLEFNLPPLRFEGDCLQQLQSSFSDAVAAVSRVAEARNVRILLTGILPSIRKSDLDLEFMTPKPRYFALNDALRNQRGGEFEIRFTGTDELIIKHDSVMLEACNTSTQFHFQVSPQDFCKLYNIAQAVAGPVLSACTNSPLLFGRRLWSETRIALFQQATDTRLPGRQLEQRSARVSFGRSWVTDSVLDVFKDDIARFRALLDMDIKEDPQEVLARGGIPKLEALQLHNSTVYRWNRPCYGVFAGRPHLRIENRYLPSGPSIVDEVANAAFWFGMISGVSGAYGDITRHLDFDDAKANFLDAARSGLNTTLTWVDGPMVAQELICEHLLPLARDGLARSGIDADDIDRYLGIIETRVTSGRTGSQWLLNSLSTLKNQGTQAEQLSALVAAAWSRQQEGRPCHEWPLARKEEAGGWTTNYQRVDQYMTTDVFTVNENEAIDLVASLMDWKHIRHVPVEDDNHRLVGLISYRQLLRFLAQDLPHGRNNPVPAHTVMLRSPITVTPETATLDAIDIMRRANVPCLPVVKDGRLVGIVSDRDFLSVAADILEDQLRRSDANV